MDARRLRDENSSLLITSKFMTDNIVCPVDPAEAAQCDACQ